MVINSAASADIREKILTFDVQNIPLESIARIFVKTLEKQGIVVVLDNGIYAVTGAQESELVITRLQNRSADYVRMIVQQAFPDVALEKKSMVVTPTQSQSSPPAQSAPGMPQQAASSTLNSPTINKRELDTELTVQSADVVILAGLDSDDESDKDRGFFGFALSRTKSKTHKQSLLVLEVLRI